MKTKILTIILSLSFMTTAWADESEDLVKQSHTEAKAMALAALQMDMTKVLSVIDNQNSGLQERLKLYSELYSKTLNEIRNNVEGLAKDPQILAKNIKDLHRAIDQIREIIRTRYEVSYRAPQMDQAMKVFLPIIQIAAKAQKELCVSGRATNDAEFFSRLKLAQPFVGACNLSPTSSLGLRSQCVGPNGEKDINKVGNAMATGADLSGSATIMLASTGNAPGAAVAAIVTLGLSGLSTLANAIGYFGTEDDIKAAQNRLADQSKYRFQNIATSEDVRKYYAQGCEETSRFLESTLLVVNTLTNGSNEEREELQNVINNRRESLKQLAQDSQDYSKAICRRNYRKAQKDKADSRLLARYAVECPTPKNIQEDSQMAAQDDQLIQRVESSYSAEQRWQFAQQQVYDAFSNVQKGLASFDYESQAKIWRELDGSIAQAHKRIVLAVQYASDYIDTGLGEIIRQVALEEGAVRQFVTLQKRFQALMGDGIDVLFGTRKKTDIAATYKALKKDVVNFFNTFPAASRRPETYHLNSGLDFFAKYFGV